MSFPIDRKEGDKLFFHYISHYYDAEGPISGGEKYNFRLIKSIQRKGYPLAIWTDDRIPSVFKKGYLLYNLWYLFKLYQFKKGIVVIDDYMHPRLFLFLFFLKMFTPTKIVGTVHHLYWPIQTNSIKRWIDKRVESFFISRFDLLIVPSRYTLSSVKEIVRKLPPAHVIHPAIDRRHIDVPYEKRQYARGQQVKLIFVGAIQQRKGVIELIHALSKVTYSDIVLSLVGDKDQRPEYVAKVKDVIRDSNLNHRVHLCGRVSAEELYRLYHEADIFVLPSFHEGYGIVVMEAMQFGLPAIVSNVAALPELVQNGVNGILVAPGDVEGIARAIDELSWSPGKRKKIGQANLKAAQEANSWEEVEGQFLMLIGDMLETES